jgi:hypothetical protein
LIETTDFFDLIYGDTEGYISIATRGDNPTDDGLWDINSEKWFLWPEEKNRVLRYVGVRDDEDVYNSVALFSDKQRTKMDRDALARVIYVDADTCPPTAFRIPPSVSVLTSEGKYHCYWVLDAPVHAHEASRVARRVCMAHAAEGCDRGFQVSKLLRVPGTTNTKYETSFKVVAESTGVIYSLSDIEDAYDDIRDEADHALLGDMPNPIIGPDYVRLEQRLDDGGLSNLFIEVPEEGQSWSERAYRLELELFRLGMTPTEVFSLMRNAACNKYDPEAAGHKTQTGVSIPTRSNPDAVLWEEVQKAFSEYKASEEILIERSEGRSRGADRREFLSLDERKWVHDNPTWVQEYVDWMAERTDSPEVYQRSMAYLILSSCFSGRGKIVTPHSQMGLNLWILGVGESTRDRKTTALTTAKSIVNDFAKEMKLDVPIDIGSDFTREGIITALGVPERDHKPALVHIDEVNGFFSEIFQKSYRAGTLEALTALYGGEVPKSMRAGKDSGNPHAGHTHLNFVGFGIEKKVASLLTVEHFESGFLARMLWAVADEPKRKKNSNAFYFLDQENTKKKFDEPRLMMVRKIQSAARSFKLDPNKVITFERDAQTRLNKWIEQADTILDHHPAKAAIAAAVVRMFSSAAKACALLAMYDSRAYVTEGDVLHVLAQCELWFRDLERMADNISGSDYEKKLQEIVDFVLGQPEFTALESTVRKKFARYRASEFDDMLNSLKKQGRLRKHPTKDQALLAIEE